MRGLQRPLSNWLRAFDTRDRHARPGAPEAPRAATPTPTPTRHPPVRTTPTACPNDPDATSTPYRTPGSQITNAGNATSSTNRMTSLTQKPITPL